LLEDVVPARRDLADEGGRRVEDLPDYRLFDSLIFRVNRLANSYFKSSSRYYQRAFGMGVPEVRLLNIIGNLPSAGAQDVVELSSMDKGLVSRALRTLIDRGYLNKIRDEQDRRRLILELTAEGRKAFLKITAAKRRRHRRALEGLSPAECRLLYHLLDKAQATAERMVEEDTGAARARARGPRGYAHSWPATDLLDHSA
jgi:DNA-binding MarR family transcriptional regulator